MCTSFFCVQQYCTALTFSTNIYLVMLKSKAKQLSAIHNGIQCDKTGNLVQYSNQSVLTESRTRHLYLNKHFQG